MRISRFARVVAVVFVTLSVIGCGGTDSPVGPLGLSEEDLSAAESHFVPIEAEGAAFERLQASGDQSAGAVRSFVEASYSPTVVFHDETFGDHREGYDDVVSMYQLFLTFFAGAQVGDEPTLIGDTTALKVIPFWDMTLGPWTFSEEQRLIEVDLIEIDAGKIGSLVLYYDLASLRTTQGDSTKFDGSLQDRYAASWASGEDVVAVYSGDAIRYDGLAGIDANGSSEIAAEAERWAGAIPDATWDLKLAFAEVSGKQAGAVFAVTSDGCTVTIGAHWNLDDAGLITNELIHYDPATLRACGWVG